MKISSVSSMSFGVQVPKSVHEKLFDEALDLRIRDCKDFFEQEIKVEKWGAHDTTSLALFWEKTDEDIHYTLGLINNYLAPLKKVVLPQKGTLLSSFLALTEKDIVDAENSLHI